ncbi:hypothetical protein T552_02404 [Pneumocystis carinii B80]|uniref:Rad21/Rec8-like protein N-terminal domain-containing protein n=1 Tax=Pneumocystis carinii (strain B80) TaxID=1408658 RepID=A0A0W4ZGD5_PNEC8|nr:hypothetical protein T552_02404 [Pneumocystis carinii B80]KTW27426.1 hypothetical protein T552_02404 [Pneumocystis carinii B80]
MFYSQEILTRRKGGLGVIWLAATLGSKTSFKKLQRKEILSVNVPKACEYLSEPPEPLALRLSSNLMMGVTRIFDQQYGFFYTDVQLTHAKIRKELATINLEKANIDLPKAKTRTDLFTLADDPGFMPDLNEYGLEAITLSWHPETSFDVELGVRESHSSSYELSMTPASFSQHTLPRSSVSMNNHMSKLDFSESISRSAMSMSGIIERDSDILGSMNGELSFDFEFDAEGEIRKIEEKQSDLSSSIHKKRNDMYRIDSDEGEETVRSQHAEAKRRKKFNHTFEKTLMAYEEVDESMIGELGETDFFDNRDPSFAPQNRNHETSSNTYEDDNQQRKRRKLLRMKMDIRTELPSEDLISWRDNYIKSMEKQSVIKTRKLQEKAALNNVHFFVWSFSEELMHPSLKAMFLDHQKQKDSLKNKKRTKSELDDESVDNRDSVTHQQTGKIHAGMNSNFEEEIELGRHVDEELTRRTSSLMPWNQSHVSSRVGSVGSGMASISFDTPSVSATGHFSSTIRKNKLIASPLADTLEDVNINIGEDAMEDFEIFETTNLDTQPILQDNQSAIMEKESYNFLEYTQARIHRKEQGHTITFEELVPISNSSRSIASQALCHVLLLASRNILTVHQAKPYEDIWIKLS